MDIKILGLNGSPDQVGHTASMINKMLDHAQRITAVGATQVVVHTEVCHLQHYITHPFHGIFPEGGMTADDLLQGPVKELMQKVKEADAILLGTPVWYSGPAGLAAAFLHNLTLLEFDDYALKGKVAGLVSTMGEDGGQHTNMVMQNALTHMGFVVPPFCSFFYNWKTPGVSEDNWQETDQSLLPLNLVRMAFLLKNAKWDWNDHA